jgi:hypothetical protein
LERLFTSKFVGTGPSSYEKRIHRAAVSQGLRNPSVRCPKYQEGLKTPHLNGSKYEKYWFGKEVFSAENYLITT